MKKITSILFLAGLFLVDETCASELRIHQALVTPYYSQVYLEDNLPSMEAVINKRLKDFDCIMGTLKYEIIKKNVSGFFKTTPGVIKLSYQTKCYGNRITGMSFAIDQVGMGDEDYTPIGLRINTPHSAMTEKYCIDAFGSEFKCYSYITDPKNFSTHVDQSGMN